MSPLSTAVSRRQLLLRGGTALGAAALTGAGVLSGGQAAEAASPSPKSRTGWVNHSDGFVVRTKTAAAAGKGTEPTASNTGVGITRAAPTPSNTSTVTGVTTLAAGTTVQGKRYTEGVTVTGANVTVIDCIFDCVLSFAADTPNFRAQNCLFSGGVTTGNAWCVMTSDSSTLPVPYFEYCTVTPSHPQVGLNAFGERNYSLFRCAWSNTVDGLSAYAADSTGGTLNVTVQGCYSPYLAQFQPDSLNGDRAETHNDNLQLQGGTGVVMIGNSLHAYASTTAGTQPPLSPILNITALQVSPAGVTSGSSSGKAGSRGACSITFDGNWVYGGGALGVNCTSMTPADTIVSMDYNTFSADTEKGSSPRAIGLNSHADNSGFGSHNRFASGASVSPFYNTSSYGG